VRGLSSRIRISENDKGRQEHQGMEQSHYPPRSGDRAPLLVIIGLRGTNCNLQFDRIFATNSALMSTAETSSAKWADRRGIAAFLRFRSALPYPYQRLPFPAWLVFMAHGLLDLIERKRRADFRCKDANSEKLAYAANQTEHSQDGLFG